MGGHLHAQGLQPVAADGRGPDAVLDAVLGHERNLAIGVGGEVDHALGGVLLMQGHVGIQLLGVNQHARIGQGEGQRAVGTRVHHEHIGRVVRREAGGQGVLDVLVGDGGQGEIQVELVVQVLQDGVVVLGLVLHTVVGGQDLHRVLLGQVVVAVVQAGGVLINAGGRALGELNVLKGGARRRKPPWAPAALRPPAKPKPSS